MVDNSSEFALFEKGNKPTRCKQGVIYGKNNTIGFTGTVCDLDLDVKTKLESKSNTKNGTKLGSKQSTKASTKLGTETSDTVTASSVFEPLYHLVGEDLINISITCTSLLQDCYGNDMKYASTNGIIIDEFSIIDQDQGRQGWYNYVDINSIGISYYYDLSMSSADVFEEGLEAIDISDDTTLVHSNVLDIF